MTMELPMEIEPEHDGSHCWKFVWHEDDGEELCVCMCCHLCGMEVVVWKEIGTADCRGTEPPGVSPGSSGPTRPPTAPPSPYSPSTTRAARDCYRDRWPVEQRLLCDASKPAAPSGQ